MFSYSLEWFLRFQTSASLARLTRKSSLNMSTKNLYIISQHQEETVSIALLLELILKVFYKESDCNALLWKLFSIK